MRVSNWVLATTAAVLIASCGNASEPAKTTATQTSTGATTAVIGKGNPDAPAKIVEYASTTCGHCATFHETVYTALQSRIDAGELYFEFHEFPTPPANIAMAGFKIARCAGEDKYYDVLGDLFENQNGILQATRQGTAKAALLAVAERHGLDEAEFDACQRDQDLHNGMVDIIEAGQARGVSSTPTLFLNGERLDLNVAFSATQLNALIDELNGIEPSEESVDDTVSDTENGEETPE